MRKFLYVLGAFFITACSTATPIMEASKSESGFENAAYKGKVVDVSENTQGLPEYRVFHQGSSSFVDLTDVRFAAERRMNTFCSQRGLAARTIYERSSVPPHILGNFPRVELIFVCEESSKGLARNVADSYEQLERLGNLLERGLISQEEFDSERTKLFAQ